MRTGGKENFRMSSGLWSMYLLIQFNKTGKNGSQMPLQFQNTWKKSIIEEITEDILSVAFYNF